LDTNKSIDKWGDGRIFEYQTFKAIAGFDPGTLWPETDKTTLCPQSLPYLLKFSVLEVSTHSEKERKTQRKSRLKPQIKTT
jgi:hypothetical protein